MQIRLSWNSKIKWIYLNWEEISLKELKEWIKLNKENQNKIRILVSNKNWENDKLNWNCEATFIVNPKPYCWDWKVDKKIWEQCDFNDPKTWIACTKDCK